MTEGQVRERYFQFGGVPRNVFEPNIDRRLDAQDRAIKAMSLKLPKQ
jgi:hypothetical protein